MTGHLETFASTPSVSVIIPTHNRRDLLTRALASVLDQTVPATEIIVVDDGSDDGTFEMLLARDECEDVRVIRLPQNAGVSAARNAGIVDSKGEWLAFLDSDDTWLPEKLERQWSELRAQPRGCSVLHCDEVWIRNGRRVNPMKKHEKTGGYIYQACLPLCAISPSAVMVHRTVFAAVGLFDEQLPACEDYDMWLRICSRYPVTYVDEPLVVKYGGHADQLSHRFEAMDRFRIRALAKILDQNELDQRDELATRTMLQEKCRIYGEGARKRGRDREADEITALAGRYQ